MIARLQGQIQSYLYLTKIQRFAFVSRSPLQGAFFVCRLIQNNKKRQRITVISLRDSLPSSKINNPSRCYGARIIVSIWQNSLIVFLNIKRQSSFLTVLLISVFSCRKIVRLQNPSRHISKHTITKAFLLKNGTLIIANKFCDCDTGNFCSNVASHRLAKVLGILKPVIARLFRAMGITAFSKKSYHKKAPHRPTKNNNQTKAFRVQKIVHLKSPVLARLSDGSGTPQNHAAAGKHCPFMPLA